MTARINIYDTEHQHWCQCRHQQLVFVLTKCVIKIDYLSNMLCSIDIGRARSKDQNVLSRTHDRFFNSIMLPFHRILSSIRHDYMLTLCFFVVVDFFLLSLVVIVKAPTLSVICHLMDIRADNVWERMVMPLSLTVFQYFGFIQKYENKKPIENPKLI